MKKKKPEWLPALHQYVKESSWNNLRVMSDREAYLYEGNAYEKVPVSYLSQFFHDEQHFSDQLAELAWFLELRFDPYHPYLCQDIEGIGRITLIRDSLLGGGSQLFLRIFPQKKENLIFDDPHGLRREFERRFTHLPWLICGASGVGKTTLLFSELSKNFADHTVVVMDRFQERPFCHPMWIFLREQSEQSNAKGRVDSYHLLDVAFKLGASTLVFGEMRREEIQPFFHGLFSGHRHIYGTFHASSPESLFLRMKMLYPDAQKWTKQSVAALFLEKDSKGIHRLVDLYLPPSFRDEP